MTGTNTYDRKTTALRFTSSAISFTHGQSLPSSLRKSL